MIIAGIIYLICGLLLCLGVAIHNTPEFQAIKDRSEMFWLMVVICWLWPFLVIHSFYEIYKERRK